MPHRFWSRLVCALVILAAALPVAAQGGLTLNDVLDNNALTFTAGNQVTWDLRATGGVNDGDAAHVDFSSGGSAWIDSTVTGPGWLTFVTNACHSLIVDTTSYSICPWQRWVPYGEGLLVRREIPAGPHAIRWVLQASGSAPLDGWLDAVEFIPIASIPLTAMTTPAGLTFSTGPAHPCHGTTWPDANGGGAIRPPAGLPESESAWVETTISGPAEVEFLSWLAGEELTVSAKIGSLNSYAFSPGGPSDKHGPGWRTTRFFITESGAVPVRWWLQAGSALDGIIARPEAPLTEALDAAEIQWTRRGRRAFYGTALNSHDGTDAVTLDRFFSGAGEAPPELATILTGPLSVQLMAKFENDDAPYITWKGNKALVRWRPADNGWQALAVAIPADGAPGELVIGGTLAPLWLDEASVESLDGRTIADGLDTTGLGWSSSPQATWQFSQLSHESNPDTIALWLSAGSQSAWLETTVTGPGVVRFYWHAWEGFMRPSSRLTVDGQEFMILPHDYGEDAPWRGFEIALPAGSHTLRWETTKDDSWAGAVAEMDAFSFTHGSTLYEGMEAGGLAFEFDDGATWSLECVDTSDGTDALRFNSDLESRHHLRSFIDGPGRLRFSWKGPLAANYFFNVSGEDRLYKNSPASQWRNEMVTLPPGVWEAEWESLQEGPGSLLLDKVVWSPAVSATFTEALDGAGLTWGADPPGSWQAWSLPGTGEDYAAPAAEFGNQPVSLSTTVVGPGYLRFRSHTNGDGITLESQAIALGTGYYGDAAATVFIPPGTQTLNWKYEAWDRLDVWLDEVSFTPLTPVSADEATETPGRVWRTGGAAPWIGSQLPPGLAEGNDALLAPFAVDSEAWVETDVAGPGVIDFSFTRVPLNEETWTVQVDGKIVPFFGATWPGIFVRDSGPHTIRWTYQTSKFPPAPFGLDNVSWIPDGTPALAEALDTTLIFTTGGTRPWQGTTIWTGDGGDAACSGSLHEDESSWLETTVAGPATVSFAWRMGEYFNYSGSPSFVLLVDGVALATARNVEMNDLPDSVWPRTQVSLPAGPHTLRWRHTGATFVPYGDPALYVSTYPNHGAWLDQVTVTPGAGLNEALDFYGPPVVASGDVEIVTGAVTHDGTDAVALGSVPGSSWQELSVPVTGPGVFSFWSQSGNTFGDLAYQLQGTPGYVYRSLNGGAGWQQTALPLAAGSSGGGALTVNFISYQSALLDELNFTSYGLAVPLAAAVEDDGGTWSTAGNIPWTGISARSHDGTDAAWSGVNSATGPATLGTTVLGPGTLTFRTFLEGSGRLRLKIAGQLIPGFAAAAAWSLHSVTLGSGTHDIQFLHEPGTGDDLSQTLVDEFSWTPGPDLTVGMAAEAPDLTWSPPSATWWQPVGYAGLDALGGHAVMITSAPRPAGITRSEKLSATLTGPGLLRFRWRRLNHYGTEIATGVSATGAALYCKVDGAIIKWITASDSAAGAWRDSFVYVPMGQHEVAWQLLSSSDVWGEVFPPAPGISGFLDAVSFQRSVAYGAWIDTHITTPPFDPRDPYLGALSRTQSPDSDPDGDGIPNAVEFAAGTLPGDGASHPEIRLTLESGHPRLMMAATTRPGVILCAEKSGDLQTWTRGGITDISAATPGFFTSEVSGATAADAPLFLRVCADITAP